MRNIKKLLLLFVLSLYTAFGQTVTVAETLKDDNNSNLVGHLFISNPPFLYPYGTAKTITGATNATPIVITSTSHGLATGNTVYITGVAGATGANGTWVITFVDANSFSLDGSSAGGVYSSGGTAQQLIPVGPQRRRYPTTGTFSGSISLTLIPTATAISSPGGAVAGFSYLVQYFLNDGSTASERWNVQVTPSSQPISKVRIASTVTPTSSINPSQLTQSAGTGTRNSKMTWTGSQWDGALVDIAINAQTGTTYTVVDGDRNSIVTLSNTSSVAVTLPQAGASGNFASGWYAWFRNVNTGRVTITPTTSTIDGASTYKLDKDEDILVVSDGTNYTITRGKSSTARGDFGCTGTTTASSTLYIAAGGPVAACTDTTEGADNKLLATGPSRIRNLRVFAGTAGVNASSGLVTVRINGTNTSLTCTIGTGTSCSDTTNHAAIVAGDRVTVSVTTQGGETLADVLIAMEYSSGS